MGHTVANIKLKQITKQFNETHVIQGVDLEVQDGEFLVFVGPSGCGKSTMLRLIAGLESISSGELLIDGMRMNNVGPSQRGAAMVFQSYALYPHMTVEENMGFGLRMSGVSKHDVKQQVDHTAETLQITPLLKRYPKQLSGGQRQRVAIGRAIVRRPKVFLFDEPLSNLDAALRVQMRIELTKLHKELKTTMIYVTHDQTEAMTLGDRIAVFNQGKIEQVGTPLELYHRPDNIFVAQFLGSPKINLLKFKLDTDGQLLHFSNGGTLDASLLGLNPHLAAQAVQIGIRPEHMQLSSPENALKAKIEFLENLGDCVIVYARIGANEDLVSVKTDQLSMTYNVHDTVYLRPRANHVMFFDENGRHVSS